MARKDFIPDSYKNLHDWSANYSAGVGAVATRIGWPTASVTALKGQLDSLTTATQAVLDAQHALDTAVGQLNALKGTALGQIRAETKSLKATNGFTEGDAKMLGVYTTPETFDPNTYTPPLEATARPVLLGRGQRIFSDSADPCGLAFVSAKATPTGVLINTYQYAQSLRAE